MTRLGSSLECALKSVTAGVASPRSLSNFVSVPVVTISRMALPIAVPMPGNWVRSPRGAPSQLDFPVSCGCVQPPGDRPSLCIDFPFGRQELSKACQPVSDFCVAQNHGVFRTAVSELFTLLFSTQASIFPRRRSHIDRLGLAVGLFPDLLAQAWSSAFIEGWQLNDAP
jgi:hypothetical protein